MKYIASIVIILAIFTGCNDESSSQVDQNSVNDAPQPIVKNSELQPPKPPSI